jgi:hypothetical protein
VLQWHMSMHVVHDFCGDLDTHPATTPEQPHNSRSPQVHARTSMHVGLTAGHRGSQKGVSYLQVDGEPWKQAIPTKDGEHFTVGGPPAAEACRCQSHLL